MAIVLDATVGGANANSYLTRVAADAILETYFGTSAWDSASSAAGGDREKALIAATRDIDRCRFRGQRLTGTQALAWPRDVQTEVAIPEAVRQACAVQALWLLQQAADGGRSPRQRLIAEGVTSFSVGNLSETFGAGAVGAGGDAHLCQDARLHLSRWILRTGRMVGQRERAGTGRPLEAMVITDYLRQSVSIEALAGADSYGQPTYAAPTSVMARYEARSSLVRDPQGQQVVSSARVYLPATVTAPVGSRVTYGGVTYQVLSLEAAEGLQGPSHQIAYLR